MFFLYYCVSTYIILYICLLCGTMKNVGISPPGLQRSTLLAPSLYRGCSPACSLLGRFVLHCPPNMSLSSWDPQSAFHKVNIKVFNCEIQDILFLKTIFIYVLKKPKGGRRWGRETWMWGETLIGCLSYVSWLGTETALGHVSSPRIKPVTFCFAGWGPEIEPRHSSGLRKSF